MLWSRLHTRLKNIFTDLCWILKLSYSERVRVALLISDLSSLLTFSSIYNHLVWEILASCRIHILLNIFFLISSCIRHLLRIVILINLTYREFSVIFILQRSFLFGTFDFLTWLIVELIKIFYSFQNISL